MKCVICNGDYTGMGHNASPMRNGRCCLRCNERHVVPSRIYAHLAERMGISDTYADMSVKDQDAFREMIAANRKA